MKIREIKENKKQFLSLLLLADEQENMIDRYLERGTMYVLNDNGVKAECVVTDEGNGILEIKNIATVPEYQGKGYAKALIDFIVKEYADKYSVLQVGTGDSPLTVPFYEKCGFVRSYIIPNFFTDYYDHPIFECGVRLVDERVMLYDYDVPLFNKEFSRTEFDRKVRENPMNEHLIVKEEPAEERNEKEPEPLVPAWEQKKKVKGFDLHPDVPMAERHTFNLRENEVETVGKKERFRRNIMAIQLLKKCQEENRFATPEEQIILSKYVGWGGLSEAFDENNSAWATEYLELSSVLTPEEYASARESTLTAFYTPPEVITAIYKAMEQMGFKEGNLLEPSCGIGNFIGMLPDAMQDSKIYGVELDTISAGIAQQLYQKTTIAAQGFEETNLPDSFFDGVVGNVPFGDFKVSDKRYDKHKFLIHDYFFAKSLDKLRPGGVMALVTSKGTMDKETLAVRKYIAQRAELLGAIRLPNNTFKGNAGTEVVSDILILQKRDRLIDIEPDWVYLDTDENGIKMNEGTDNQELDFHRESKKRSNHKGIDS